MSMMAEKNKHKTRKGIEKVKIEIDRKGSRDRDYGGLVKIKVK